MAHLSARQCFDHLRAVIDQAMAEKTFTGPLEAAKELGMTEMDIREAEYRYRLSDENGGEVQLHCRWRAESRSFNPEPGEYRFTLTCSGDEDTLHHQAHSIGS